MARQGALAKSVRDVKTPSLVIESVVWHHSHGVGGLDETTLRSLPYPSDSQHIIYSAADHGASEVASSRQCTVSSGRAV